MHLRASFLKPSYQNLSGPHEENQVYTKSVTFSLLILILFAAFAFAVDNQEKVMVLHKTDRDITIDGIIDPAWSRADSVSDFVQQSPYYHKPPSRKTVAKVLTTDQALYCIMICFEKKENIQRNTGKLDEFTGDIVSIMLDTFGDHRTAYKFAVTASGVRNDARLLDDARNRDYAWDGIWFSAARVYDWGFVVEMEIPYKSIQYREGLMEWGLDFDRWIPTLSEDLYWCDYEENEGQRISKFGKLVFGDFQPTAKGLHLEVYPVGITKATYQFDDRYDVNPDAGVDVFYNPSSKLTFQLTANPDFAQIEADPFEFNISRYETYYSERRPFFTEGSEVFTASGRQRNTGFYKPLELFYSRRIGRKLPDGQEVPFIFGTKAFGRINRWEYGGFLALTGQRNYIDDEEPFTEERALFGSARLNTQIFGNSSVGLLFVGKHTRNGDNGVMDVDGAFRTSTWQLAYQLARSYRNSQGDYAGSAGFTMFEEKWLALVRGRYIGHKFDVEDVGFVPWQGTADFVALFGPRWYFKKGYISQILMYAGPILSYERADRYTDSGGAFGFNMQFRDNWGYEINTSLADAKDSVRYTYWDATFSSWYNISPKWDGNLYGGYSRTFNFSREFLAYYSWLGLSLDFKAATILQIGTSADMFIEGNPAGNIEEITYNTRPYFSLTPINNLNLRVYVDNLWERSSGSLEQLLAGFLFSYNFSPKSWIYFALNDVRDRSDQFDTRGRLLPPRLHVTDRVSVFKIKYLYYF